ncbi:MAG TPA: hypothetical protein VGX78_21035 [Pirellulales bacterium]|jgi:hypothetical protein|nr:hypothetical protein [Pirellulales bacterium]
MFLVKDNRHGATYHVFLWEDPRKAGYKGPVEEGISLDYDMEAVHAWPDGQDAPEVAWGQAPDNPKHFTVFRYERERQSAGYLPVVNGCVLGSWTDYLKLHLLPPDPDGTADELWYDYLDKVDDDSRRRRKRLQAPALPTNTSRDEVAAWVAKKHLIADAAVREVWYLPRGAPPEEIRLLELNDRLAGTESNAEAIDFGLDIDGAQFRLYVADITSEQLNQIKQDPSRLPRGWSLDENRIWRRGA